MKKTVAVSLLAALAAFSSLAQQSAGPQIQWYGFIRNYYAFDTHESTDGTGDLYYYFPTDEALVGEEDINAIPSLRYSALTSRLGFNLLGYEYDGYSFGGKVEADFYSGLTNVTGTAQFRLRQAYLTLSKDGRSWKLGQAWHPMAADLPDIFSLESGVPFGPFSRTPQVTFEKRISKSLTLTVSALTQMQYISPGVSVTKLDAKVAESLGTGILYKYTSSNSADFAKYSCIPEIYAGLTFKGENGLLRLGADLTTLRPRNYIYDMKTGQAAAKADELQRELSFFQYGTVRMGNLTVKEKITYAHDCSHMNMIGGYGVSAIGEDGSWEYTTTSNISGWLTLQYKQKDCRWVPSVLFGCIRNFGTDKDVLKGEAGENLFFGKNGAGSIESMYRIQPEVLYNLGKFQIGLEYMLTAVMYGKAGARMLPEKNLHEVVNHRIQIMTKFNF